MIGICCAAAVALLMLLDTAAGRSCRFPEHWTGLWYQKGAHPPIRLEEDTFSFKGTCVDSEGHMFLIEDSRERCFRCVVIHEKHLNVLQYRETYCDEYRTLKQACQRLNVDAHLYSMFRVGASPIHCPFKGPFTFNYSRGQGECTYPMSTIDSCMDDTRILFRFQACADVRGTESSVEELTCLAKWKDGSAYYLVGKMTHRKSHGVVYSESDSYRCFVYEHLPDGSGFQVSQSADATCDGLVSPREGSRIMRLTKGRHPTSGCQFPVWATGHRWHTLNGRKTYVFTHGNTTLKINHESPGSHQTETKLTCIDEIASTSNTSVYVGYSMSGCDNGYVCLTFHKRDTHIIEIQMGDLARRPQEACQPPSHHPNYQEYVTLMTPSPGSNPCPQLVETNGLRVHSDHPSLRPEVCRDSRTVVTGCRTHDTIEFLTTCATFQDMTTFRCHGGWQEKGRGYVILGVKGSKTKYCLVYLNNNSMTRLSGLHDTCHRSVVPGITGNLTFNISAAGECEYIRNSTVGLTGITCLVLALTAVLLMR